MYVIYNIYIYIYIYISLSLYIYIYIYMYVYIYIYTYALQERQMLQSSMISARIAMTPASAKLLGPYYYYYYHYYYCCYYRGEAGCCCVLHQHLVCTFVYACCMFRFIPCSTICLECLCVLLHVLVFFRGEERCGRFDTFALALIRVPVKQNAPFGRTLLLLLLYYYYTITIELLLVLVLLLNLLLITRLLSFPH